MQNNGQLQGYAKVEEIYWWNNADTVVIISFRQIREDK